MRNPDTSRELAARLSYGKDSVRQQQRFGAESDYVQHVRAYVAECPNSGAQQNRLRHMAENWLVSQWRWIVEQRAAGAEWSKIRRVMQGCLDEIDVLEQMELASVVGTISPDTFAEMAKQETAAEMYENSASEEALHHRTVGAYRRVADFCNAQIEALTRKARVARLMAAKLTQRAV
jgi:hypothetical protein